MIRTTPFHDRVEALNKTQLWSHWAGQLVAEKYQMSEKFEYFAIRNAAGIFDTSPLYKYRIIGPDAEHFLAGILARDIRTCQPGQAQYQIWCDDRGFVIEDAVILRVSSEEYLLTTVEPNLAYFQGLVGRLDVEVIDLSNEIAALALQGPRSRAILSSLAPEIEALGYFDVASAKIGQASVTVSRTGYTGDLGYEVWVDADDAVAVWDAVMEAGEPHQLIPFGQIALVMTRIEAGLLLIDVDFESSRYAFNDAHKSTPHELGLGWMLRDVATTDRAFIGRKAIRRELADGTSRWKLVGLVVDWEDFDAKYRAAGLIPPKDHTPVHEDMMVYTDNHTRVGYATSSMYSPMLQRHIAIARVQPNFATTGTRLNLEYTIDHEYRLVGADVARLPLFNAERKTS